jgi:hypothetical protein
VNDKHLSASNFANIPERDTIFLEAPDFRHRMRSRFAYLRQRIAAAITRTLRAIRDGLQEDLILHAATICYVDPDLLADREGPSLRSRLYRVERFEEVDALVERINRMMERQSLRQDGPAQGE